MEVRQEMHGLQNDAFIVKEAKNNPSKRNSLIKHEETMSGQQETAAQATDRS